MLKWLNRIIAGGFYLLFFSVPLVFSASTSELFEYNKMMTVYALTVIIGAAWLIKMVILRKWVYRHSFLEIPLVLYLSSHVLSTIFSIDPHVSVWGFYSRFNEGLLASLSYILLYFAAVSNLNFNNVKRILRISLTSAAIVSLWGAMEHFGNSPSCMLIMGRPGVDCWLQDVRNRVFATLGQPNWMAAYLDVVILMALGWILTLKKVSLTRLILYLALPALFLAALLFTKSRSGVGGLGVGLALFLVYQLITAGRKFLKPAIAVFIPLVMVGLIFGLPFAQTEKLSLENFLARRQAAGKSAPAPLPPDILISESADIRRPVWEGAIKVWQRYPAFGSGVETFAESFYKDRPVSKNMDSEWDFLYNKAHNEYLNLLATTGTVGILTYGLFILGFIYWTLRKVFRPVNPLLAAFFAGWVTILVTNYYGFSVVIIGLYFFLIPAFAFLLASGEGETQSLNPAKSEVSGARWLLIAIIGLAALVLEMNLANMWNADILYADGRNRDTLSQAEQFIAANASLTSAVAANPGEPTFRDELAYNQAVLASALYAQIKSSSTSAIASLSAQEKLNIRSPQLGASVNDYISQAVANSNQVVESAPDSLLFWKNRAKLFYLLSAIDNKYSLQAIEALRQGVALAPTEAKVHYNLGLVLGRTGNISEGIKVLQETVAMKPDYRDAYYTLGLLYSAAGDKVKARQTMEFVNTRFGPDKDAQSWLEANR